MGLKVVIPKEKKKIEQLIKALEKQIKIDTNERDRQIHTMALGKMKEALAKGNYQETE
ncbi:MAG: hypothetical protein AB2421_17800 [Thermotaleaceae bacterium]